MEISASPKDNISFYAVIAAAGSGERLGGSVPKQYQRISGKAILRHTLEVFLSCPGLRELCVVIDPKHRALYDEAVSGLSLPEPVAGGKQRKDSVYNGLNYFSHVNKEEIILFHDAARPLVAAREIEAVATAAHEKGAATLAAPVTDTQKYASGAYVERKDLWAIQTPQGFRHSLIRQAHEAANDGTEYTDDTALLASLGHRAELVAGSRANIKITTQDDMDFARRLMEAGAFETRTGFGYDVHAFTEGGKVRLCGVDIPHTKSLAGHSDADVGLHAITDALLGAIGEADIGQHFPPSDPQWKDKDSAIFLQRAVELVGKKQGRIVNLDLTLICEEPKIGPHREKMQRRVAQICGIAPGRVGIKATTTEKLGFTGRGEGIAAQAVATVRLPESGFHV